MNRQMKFSGFLDNYHSTFEFGRIKEFLNFFIGKIRLCKVGKQRTMWKASTAFIKFYQSIMIMIVEIRMELNFKPLPSHF
jgi:hypothetical protein